MMGRRRGCVTHIILWDVTHNIREEISKVEWKSPRGHNRVTSQRCQAKVGLKWLLMLCHVFPLATLLILFLMTWLLTKLLSHSPCQLALEHTPPLLS